MTWTDPRTWVTGEVVTSSQLNTHLRDNLDALEHRFYVENNLNGPLNTTSEVSLFNTQPVIPAGAMGANGMFRLLANGDGRQISFCTFTIRVKIGATTIHTHVDAGAGGSGNAGSVDMELRIWNTGSTGSQRYYGLTLGSATYIGGDYYQGTASIDTTAAKTVDVTVQPSVADAGNYYRWQWKECYIRRN